MQLLHNFIIVPKVVVSLVVHFPNSQMRLSLCQLPAESQTYKLCCDGQEFTVAFTRQ